MAKVVVVGAGISGLALAYRLQHRAPTLEIEVLEKRDRPGGTIWTQERDGFHVEIGPNGFLDSKPATRDLCRDLGLEADLVSASAAATKNRFLFLDDRLRLLPNTPGSLLQSDLLSWRAKVGLFFERFRRQRCLAGDESIYDFARRRVGAEIADVFADALVTGIFAGDPALLSVRACFPRIATLEAQHGSIVKGLMQSARERRAEAAAKGKKYERSGTMYSLRGGLRLLIEKLRDRLTRSPTLGTAVRRIVRTSPDGRQSWQVEMQDGTYMAADAVVLTCPAYQQAVLLADHDKELANQIRSIAYNRVAVVALGFRQADIPGSVDGFGYITPQRLRADVLGVQWCSSIFPERAPAGMVLLRAMCGGWHRAEVVGWDDNRLTAAVREDLRRSMGITAAPVMRHIKRWDRAIPQYHLGHLARVAWIEDRLARHPGLFLGGNAYKGVAMNDCVEQAGIVAERVASHIAGNWNSAES